jgi:hypothetical protein
MNISRNVACLLLAAAFPAQGWCLTLGEFYSLEPTNRVWYLGGIYDANVIDWSNKGQRSKCIEGLGLPGFTKKLSEFVVSLPSDPNAKERRAYDGMNVALIAVLVIDKECKK